MAYSDNNKLDKMFDIQRQQDKKWIDFGRFKSDNNYKNEIVKERIMDIQDQVMKLANEYKWKRHLFDRTDVNYNNVLEQIIDILKYLIGFAILNGYNVLDVYDKFLKKSSILDIKWNNDNNRINRENFVFVSDLDGCIIDYDIGYKKFMKSKGFEVDNTERKTYSYHTLFGIDKPTEEKYYDEFIKKGMLQKLTVYPGVIETLNKLKNMNIKIVFITARPYWIYKNIAEDTYLNLYYNRVPYDFLLFDKDKSDAIVSKIMPANILAMVEDRDKHAMEIAGLDLDVLVLKKTYNQNLNETNRIRFVDNWRDIENIIINKILK